MQLKIHLYTCDHYTLKIFIKDLRCRRIVREMKRFSHPVRVSARGTDPRVYFGLGSASEQMAKKNELNSSGSIAGIPENSNIRSPAKEFSRIPYIYLGSEGVPIG